VLVDGDLAAVTIGLRLLMKEAKPKAFLGSLSGLVTKPVTVNVTTREIFGSVGPWAPEMDPKVSGSKILKDCLTTSTKNAYM